MGHFDHESVRSDEGLTLETSAFKFLCGGQFTISTQLLNPFLRFIIGAIISISNKLKNAVLVGFLIHRPHALLPPSFVFTRLFTSPRHAIQLARRFSLQVCPFGIQLKLKFTSLTFEFEACGIIHFLHFLHFFRLVFTFAKFYQCPSLKSEV